LDIALKTENKEEYDEVVEYYERYLKREAPQQVATQATSVAKTYYNWKDELDRKLEERLNRNVNIRSYRDYFKIYTANEYRVFIVNEGSNILRVSGILSYNEFQFLNSNRNEFRGSKMDVEIIKGNDNHYNSIWGTINGLKSRNIQFVYKDEEEKIIGAVFDFITRVELIKRKIR
jgi:hypothetical protein